MKSMEHVVICVGKESQITCRLLFCTLIGTLCSLLMGHTLYSGLWTGRHSSRMANVRMRRFIEKRKASTCKNSLH